MSPAPFPPPPTTGDADNRISNYSLPPLSLDSVPITSSSAQIPPGIQLYLTLFTLISPNFIAIALFLVCFRFYYFKLGFDIVHKLGPVTLTARSRLYEICAKSHWQLPEFTCCNETGPSNHRS